MYRIFCEVKGGVTGHRCSHLQRDGEIVTFDSCKEAKREAERLNEKMNGNPHRTATFHYEVEYV